MVERGMRLRFFSFASLEVTSSRFSSFW